MINAGYKGVEEKVDILRVIKEEMYLLIRSLNVVLSCVIKLSTIVFQYGRQLASIWNKAGSRSKSKTSLRHALRVYW